MRLIMVRHAEAGYDAPSDFERILTDKGHRQSKRVGAFLAAIEVQPDRIVSSPMVRARETAEHLAKALKPKLGLIEDERVACGMRPEEACEILRECSEDETIILTGHEPDFSRTVAYLIGMQSNGNIDFKKAASAFLEIETPAQAGGVLRAFVPVKQTPKQ